MCGIVGYIGGGRSVDVLIDGLKKLEYRGYDSAGIAVFQQGRMMLVRPRDAWQTLKSVLRKPAFLTDTAA